VVIELEVPNPLLNLRVLTYWPFVNSLLLLVVVMTGMFTGLYFIPQYLQNVQGMQAFNAGLVLLPASLVVLVMMPIAGRIYDAVGPRWPVTIGMLIAAYASYQLAQMNVETPRHFIEVNLAIRNFGLGLSMMPIMTAGLAALPTALSGAGSTMNNVMRQVISSVSVAALTGMNTDSAQQLMADRGALYDSGAQMLPQIAAYQEQGPSGMLGLYTMLNNEITTQTYANGFYLVAVMSLASVGLTLALRSGGNSTAKAAKPEIVEV
jgi:MFS family permease